MSTAYRGALDPGRRARTKPDGPTLLDRFLAKVEFRADGHWLWTGAAQRRQGRNHRAYGQIGTESHRASSRRAHEVSYRMLVGEIPPGWDLLTCSVELCVHPDHQLPVPQHGAGDQRTARRAGTLRATYAERKLSEVTLQDLADELSVTREAIRLVLTGRIKGIAGKLAGRVEEIRARYTGPITARELGRELGLSAGVAADIVSGRTYRYACAPKTAAKDDRGIA